MSAVSISPANLPGRNQINLCNRIAVVTGGTGGIGLATAKRLLSSDATVLIWDINGAGLSRLEGELPAVRTMHVDLLEEDAVAEATASVIQNYGRIDILVNSVGVEGVRAAVVDYTVADWQRILNVNLTASFIACKYVVRAMLPHDYGRIVNLSSTAGKDGNPLDSAYSAAKAGIMGLTKSLSKEVATTGIRVNCVCPAAIDGPLFSRLGPEQQRFSISKIPVGRLGRAEEVAALISWLCSEECSFSTGATFDISGGRSTY